jgi:hypothetical protein
MTGIARILSAIDEGERNDHIINNHRLANLSAEVIFSQEISNRTVSKLRPRKIAVEMNDDRFYDNENWPLSVSPKIHLETPDYMTSDHHNFTETASTEGNSAALVSPKLHP